MVIVTGSGPSTAGKRRVLDTKLPVPALHLSTSTVGSVSKLPDRPQFLSHIIANPDDAPVENIDPGVFNVEQLAEKLYPRPNQHAKGTLRAIDGNWAGGQITVGTYDGTQAAITHAYQRLGGAYGSFLDALGIESSLPRYVSLEKQRENYKFSQYPIDNNGCPATYPPHLDIIPVSEQFSSWAIFNNLGLAAACILIKKILPDEFLGKTRDWLLSKKRGGRKSGTDIARGDNIGLLSDWFSDRRFAEQSFSGTNPVTITQAPEALIGEFIKTALRNGEGEWAKLLAQIGRDTLFVQDYRYFREAIGVGPTEIMQHQEPGADMCWAVAPVALFQLHEDGKLHPIAITIDYKQSMESSVTLFNKRKTPSDPKSGEKEDWPWRYAKTCLLSADWIRHELTIHLNDSHFIEEALIVATNRTIPMDNIIYRILSPHWYKTLSLNAAGRSTLVPQVIQDIIGFSPEQTSNFVRSAYEEFDFVGNYVPQQLERRGFPSGPDELKDKRYKNYPYARDMSVMWLTIRKYVKGMLLTEFTEGEEAANEWIAADRYIRDWCAEVQKAGHISTFPTIQTLDQLVDAITMCIHIAAPYHTAVNYLQNYYQAFVAAKPSSLCAAPPTTLEELQGYQEKDLVRALPINRQRQWLLAAHIPWLLSFKVASERSLLNFALSQYNVYKWKTGEREARVREVTSAFYTELTQLQIYFYDVSAGMDEGSIPYMVMDPGSTAVSILI